MPPGTNDSSVYSAAPRSTDAVALPDSEGAHDIRGLDRASALIINGLDENADLVLEGAAFDDPGFVDPVAIGSETVMAGETALLSLPNDDRVAYLRVEATPVAAPTSGEIEAKYHTHNEG